MKRVRNSKVFVVNITVRLIVPINVKFIFHGPVAEKNSLFAHPQYSPDVKKIAHVMTHLFFFFFLQIIALHYSRILTSVQNSLYYANDLHILKVRMQYCN